MNDLGVLTKAPLPVEIDGDWYSISPLTINMLGEFSRYLQYFPFHVLQSSDMDPATKRGLLAEVWVECGRKQPTLDDIQKTFTDHRHVRELLYLSLRVKHPTISRTTVGSFPLAKLEELSDKLGESMSAGVTEKKVTPEVNLKPLPNSVGQNSIDS